MQPEQGLAQKEHEENDRMLKEKYDKLTDDEKQSIKANQEKIANR